MKSEDQANARLEDATTQWRELRYTGAPLTLPAARPAFRPRRPAYAFATLALLAATALIFNASREPSPQIQWPETLKPLVESTAFPPPPDAAAWERPALELPTRPRRESCFTQPPGAACGDRNG